MRFWPVWAALALAVLVGAVWVVPGWLDWNQYRDSIAALIGQQLGRPVRIGGAVTLQLLPQPLLTAADVAVEDAGDGVGLHAGAVRLQVGLGALLAGKVDARELVLHGAELRLPWPPAAGALARRPPAWITGLSARVEEGRLLVGGLALSGIDGTLMTDPDTGTLSAAGVGRAGDGSWRFTARLGRPGGDGSAGLQVSLDGQDRLRDTGAMFTGQLGGDGALTGRVSGRGPDLSLLMPAPALPWRGDGRLNAAAGLAVADELALEIGGAPARGAVALRVVPDARLDLAIAAGRLDLDAWVPALLERRAGTGMELPTGIDLSAEAATLWGGVVRRVRAAVDLRPDGILLRELDAVLPGEAQLAASGAFAGRGQLRFEGAVRVAAPELRTTLQWAGRAGGSGGAAALPGWGATGLAGLPAGALRTAEVSAHVVADAGSVALTDVSGVVDATPVAGAAGVRLGAGRPGVTVAVRLGRVELDGYVPAGVRLPREQEIEAGLAVLRGVDADLRVQVADGMWGAVPLGALALEVQTDAQRVVVRRLEAGPPGLRLAASGGVGEGGRLSDGRLQVTVAELAAVRPLLAATVPMGPAARLLQGPGTLTLQAAGPAEAVATRVVAEASDLRAEVSPVVNLRRGTWAGAVTLHHPGATRLLGQMGLPGTATWLGEGSLSLVGQLAGGKGRARTLDGTLSAGAFRMSGQLAWQAGRLTGAVAGESLALPRPGPWSGAGSGEPLPFGWLQGWGGAVRLEAASVSSGSDVVATGVSAELTLENGVLSAQRVAARAAGGSVAGSVRVDAAAVPPAVTVQGTGTGVALGEAGAGEGGLEGRFGLAVGQGEVTLDATASGNSPGALLATLDGSGFVRVREGVASGFDLRAAGEALAGGVQGGGAQGVGGQGSGGQGSGGQGARAEAVRMALGGGVTPFTLLELRLAAHRGSVAVDGRMESGAGRGELSGSVDLVDGAAALAAALTPALDTGPGPALGLRITGVAPRLVEVPDLTGLAEWSLARP